MERLRTIWSSLTSEEGHGTPFLGVLPAAAGAVALGFGAAGDTGWLAIAGGIALAAGVFVTPLLMHMSIEYDIYNRLNKLEGSE